MLGLAMVSVLAALAAVGPGPCPPVACKGHLGRTHCPGKPEQCQRPSHAPCAPCVTPAPSTSMLACLPPHDHYPFCDASLSVPARISDLVSRINDTDKPGLLTARGLQALPTLGVPAYYWGTNCIHSISDLASCVTDNHNKTRCPTNFPSGPSFAATFHRGLIRQMAAAIGMELRAFAALGGEGLAGGSAIGLDCWGPVLNLARDPRWGRNGEGGTEDAYAMAELAKAWTHGLQSPRPSLLNGSRQLLQVVVTLKHFAVNTLENTAPYTRTNFDANATFGVSKFTLADYYLRAFKSAVSESDARGIMCSYNSVLGVPSCLSPLLRNARQQWGFQGYVTSDTDSVDVATTAHHFTSDPEHATALALTNGQCDVNSGDTYKHNLLSAVQKKVGGLTMADVDRALGNVFKQRFDLGLFDGREAYDWPSREDIGTERSHALNLQASRESLTLLRNDFSMLPLPKGRKVAVVGPHAGARELLIQPYPSMVSHFPDKMIWCPDNKTDCIRSPFEAIAAINNGSIPSDGSGWTKTAAGCDVFDKSQSGFDVALALAKEADYVVVGLGISDCGPDSPIDSGTCYKHSSTAQYEYPDGFMEMEAHDRTSIDLPPTQQAFAKAVLALNKPTVVFLLNAGAVSMDGIASHATSASAPLAIIEAFYPGLRGAQALAEGIFGDMNAWGRLPYTIYSSSFATKAAMTEHDLRVAPGRTYRYHREPQFAFGTGLSLTNWSLTGDAPTCLAALSTSAPAKACAVTLSLHNTGTLAGDSVVLAYWHVKRDKTEWDARRGGANDSRGQQLLTPLKQLFDFQRVNGVKAGGFVSIVFNVTAAALAEVDEKSGDLVSDAAEYELWFEDGGGQVVQLQAFVVGARRVLDKFPL